MLGNATLLAGNTASFSETAPDSNQELNSVAVIAVAQLLPASVGRVCCVKWQPIANNQLIRIDIFIILVTLVFFTINLSLYKSIIADKPCQAIFREVHFTYRYFLVNGVKKAISGEEWL